MATNRNGMDDEHGTAGISIAEVAAILLLLATLIFAVMLAWLAPDRYSVVFNQEDQLVEYAQFGLLILLSVVCIHRAYGFFRHRRFLASFNHLFFGVLLFLVAAEEISWGQRLLQIETPELLAENNRQGEMNFHNLRVGSGQVADYIYVLVEAGLVVYLLILPFVYKISSLSKTIVEGLALPIAKPSVPVLLVLALLVSELVIDRWLVITQGDELTEFCVMYCIGLIIFFPRNTLVH